MFVSLWCVRKAAINPLKYNNNNPIKIWQRVLYRIPPPPPPPPPGWVSWCRDCLLHMKNLPYRAHLPAPRYTISFLNFTWKNKYHQIAQHHSATEQHAVVTCCAFMFCHSCPRLCISFKHSTADVHLSFRCRQRIIRNVAAQYKRLFMNAWEVCSEPLRPLNIRIVEGGSAFIAPVLPI